jgi:hypothetical protein
MTSAASRAVAPSLLRVEVIEPRLVTTEKVEVAEIIEADEAVAAVAETTLCLLCL